MLAVTGPFSPEECAAAAAAVLLPMIFTWLVMRGKLRRAQRESSSALEQLRTTSEAALLAEQTKAAAFAEEITKASTAAAASFADLQQRFNTHREVAERRSSDASQQISRLESELTATREIAAQLAPTQSRIKDLETALAAEQGRMKAQEQAIAATNARAADFEKRLIEAQELVINHKAEMQACLVELKKARDEHAAYSAAGGAEAELAKAREANQQAETKIGNLQRALKAAEARIEMVQKEFMNAVGLATAPTPSASAGGTSDKKLRDLEEKLAQMEAESRKRAREDGYKIAELEYRLSEALETAKVATASATSEPVIAPAPLVEPAPVAAHEPTPPVESAPLPLPEPVVEPAPAIEPPAPAEATPSPSQPEPVIKTPKPEPAFEVPSTETPAPAIAEIPAQIAAAVPAEEHLPPHEPFM